MHVCLLRMLLVCLRLMWLILMNLRQKLRRMRREVVQHRVV
jgi:hypothetical protein